MTPQTKRASRAYIAMTLAIARAPGVSAGRRAAWQAIVGLLLLADPTGAGIEELLRKQGLSVTDDGLKSIGRETPPPNDAATLEPLMDRVLLMTYLLADEAAWTGAVEGNQYLRAWVKETEARGLLAAFAPDGPADDE